MRLRIATAVVAASVLSCASAQAGVILGGSTLVDSTYLARLEGWLGEGQLTLTNIYTKTAGDTTANFHAAADGKGRTFVVLSAREDTGNSAVIGGYNPQSWNAGLGTYHITDPLADRTAFVFNLTGDYKYDQRTTPLPCCADSGRYQTYNAIDYGPDFGGGFDIGMFNSSLDLGYSYLYSYAPDNATAFHSLVDGSAYNGVNVEIFGLEVFTIAPFADAPEPATLALLGVGLIGLGWSRRNRS
jgi:hypothetical protein